MEDLYACCSHGVIQLAIMSDALSAATRRMLAYAKWETYEQGEKLIARMRRREAA